MRWMEGGGPKQVRYLGSFPPQRLLDLLPHYSVSSSSSGRLANNKITIWRCCLKERVQFLHRRYNFPALVSRIGIPRARAQKVCDFAQRHATSFSPSPQQQSGQGSNIISRNFELTLATRMNLGAKSGPIDHRLQPIGDHRQCFGARFTLRHRVEQGDLCQPETSVTNELTFEPHVRSLQARFKIACASLSLISRCRGTASSRSPSVHQSWRRPLRATRHPQSASLRSRSRRFTPEVYTKMCTDCHHNRRRGRIKCGCKRRKPSVRRTLGRLTALTS